MSMDNSGTAANYRKLANASHARKDYDRAVVFHENELFLLIQTLRESRGFAPRNYTLGPIIFILEHGVSVNN